MSLDQKTIAARDMFMPIALFEHHQRFESTINHLDICDLLYGIWTQITNDARSSIFTFEEDSVLSINHRIAQALKGEPSVFRDRNGWLKFLEELKSVDTIERLIKEDPSHTTSWMFSQLYWNHITTFRLSTVFMFINAIRIQYGLEENRLVINKLGPFLNSLARSGPPGFDGQTFSPDDRNYSCS